MSERNEIEKEIAVSVQAVNKRYYGPAKMLRRRSLPKELTNIQYRQFTMDPIL